MCRNPPLAQRGEGIVTLQAIVGNFVALVPESDVNFPVRAVAWRATMLRLWHATGRQRAPLVVFDNLQAAGILAPQDARTAPLRAHIASVVFELRRLSREGMREYPDWHGCPVVVLSLTARSNLASKERVPGFHGRPRRTAQRGPRGIQSTSERSRRNRRHGSNRVGDGHWRR